MKSNMKKPTFDEDESLWDTPFKPEDTKGLAKDIEEQDARVRRIRLSLPLGKRMKVLVVKPRGGRSFHRDG